jgi:PAS domain S-box-containing protein
MTPLSVLFVEDSEADALLAVRELRRAGFDPRFTRVESAEGMGRALSADSWDVVLADYVVPGFGALEALALVRACGLDVPFIVLSGAVGEEVAVEAMKAGAHDYMMKDRLVRLGPAVRRELAEAEVRRARKLASQRLVEQQQELTRLLASEREARAAALRSSALIHAIIHETPDAIAVKDLSGRYILVNEPTTEIIGRPAEGIIGKDDRDLLPPDLGRRVMDLDRDVIESGDANTTEERVELGGVARTFLSTRVAYRDSEGRVAGVIGVARDITDRKRAEEALARRYLDAREAIRARDEFLGIAAHELRTPITSLRLRTSRLLMACRAGNTESLGARMAAHAEGIDRATARLQQLVDELLDASRIRMGRLVLERADVDLSLLAGQVIERFRDLANQAGCSVSLRVPGPVIGRWDRSRIEQVIGNLVSNALKYGAGRPVELTVEKGPEHALLSVRDRGIGISPDAQARIFEPFERLVPSHHYSGFGLGLWIARQLVDAHRGTISVSSAPSEGSVFTMELPLAQPREAFAPASREGDQMNP